MLAEGDKEKLPTWLRKDDWNELTVRAQGDRIQIWLNGNPTVDYTELDEIYLGMDLNLMNYREHWL